MLLIAEGSMVTMGFLLLTLGVFPVYDQGFLLRGISLTVMAIYLRSYRKDNYK